MQGRPWLTLITAAWLATSPPTRADEPPPAEGVAPLNDGDRVALGLAAAGKVDDAVTAWRRMVLADPISADAPQWQARIARALLDAGRRGDAEAATTALRDTYVRDGAWRATATPAAWERAQGLWGQALLDLARRAAEDARAGGPLTPARDAYLAYIAEFPKDAEVRAELGALNVERGELEQGMRALTLAADDAEDLDRARDDAAAALGAAELWAAADAGPDDGLSKAERQLIGLRDGYAKRFPIDPASWRGMLASADLLVTRGMAADAFSRYRAVLAAHPEAAEVTPAIRRILGAYTNAEDWDGLREAVTFLRGLSGLDPAVVDEDLRDAWGQVELVRIAAMPDALESARAAERLLDEVRGVPIESRVRALAAQRYDAAGKRKDAERLRRQR